MSSDIMDFSFGAGDDSIGSGKFERFKGREGETYRLSFGLWFVKDGMPDFTTGSPRFSGARRFYIPGVGYILDNKSPELARLAGGPPKVTVATIVISWPLDRKGQIDKERFMVGDADVLPWVFSGVVYEKFKKQNAEWPFAKHDLMVDCTDTQYQKMDFRQGREMLYGTLWASSKGQEAARSLFERVQALVPSLSEMLGRSMTVDQVREKMGQQGVGPHRGGEAPGGVTAGAVDDILASVMDEP